MKLIILFCLFAAVKTFEAFDCASNPRNIKTFNLQEVERCEIPENQFKNSTEVHVQIVKNQVKKCATTFTCKLYRTITVTKCGFNGIEYGGSFEKETSAPVVLSSGECRRLLNEKKISMYSKEFKANSLGHFSFDADVIGRRSLKGGCPEVGDFTIGDKEYNGWLETATVWGSVLKRTAPWSPTTKEIYLKDGAIGRYDMESYSTSYETTIWDKDYDDDCEDNVGLIYEGKANQYTIEQDNDQKDVIIVEVPAKSLYFGLHLQNAKSVCGFHGFSTQFPDI